MELSNDQKAILRLLAQRGAAGYDDLSALLGIDAAEVHERAKAAAAQLEAEGIPAPSIPAPGAAEPKPPAEPVAPLPAPPAAAKPRPVTAPAPAPSAKATPSQPPKLSLPKSGGARAALAAGVAVLVALIVVLAVSGGGESGDATTSASSEGTTNSEETISAASNPKLTQAVLSPVDGGDGKGVATFGRVKNSLALQIEAEGLEPTGNGQSYTIWLYESPQKMLPLASTAVGAGRQDRRPGRGADRSARLPRQRNLRPARYLPHRRRHPESVAGQGDEGKEGADLYRRRHLARDDHRADRRRRKESKKRNRAQAAGSSLPGFMIPVGSS